MTTTVAPPPPPTPTSATALPRTERAPVRVDTPSAVACPASSDDHTRSVYAAFDKAYQQNWETMTGKFWWERYPPDHAAYANLVLARNRRVVALAPGGESALDVGSGLGDILFDLRRKYGGLCGVDPSAASCRIAADNFRVRKVGNHFDFRQGLAERLPFADRTFDLVTCLDTYEHIEPDRRRAALLEARRVLTPVGRLIIVTPSRRALRAWTVVDNLLTLRRQIKWRRDPRLRRPVEWFALNKKDYCEVFCTRRECARQLREAGFVIERFERVGFYPAPERGGFIYWHVNGKKPDHWKVRASVAFVNLFERLGLGQKMLFVARPAGGAA